MTLLGLAIILAACGGCETPTLAPPSERVSVEVYTESDDGLTQRLAEAVRTELGARPPVLPEPSPMQGVLRLVIPPVDWLRTEEGLIVIYDVRVTWRGRDQTVEGSCHERNLLSCAQEISRAAVAATGG